LDRRGVGGWPPCNGRRPPRAELLFDSPVPSAHCCPFRKIVSGGYMLNPLRCLALPAAALALALVQTASAEDGRSALGLGDLKDGAAVSLVQNDAFRPADDHAAPEAPLNGKLVLAPTEMEME